MPEETRMLNFAIDVALQAGQLIKDHVDKQVIVGREHHDIKLEIDVQTESLIRDEIIRKFPHHSILGEERSGIQGSADFVWIIDPLDGTFNYAHGYPHSCVSIGCFLKNRPHLGVIYDPWRDEMFSGTVNGQACLNKEPIHVSSVDNLQEALTTVGFPKTAENVEKSIHLITDLSRKAGKVRSSGSAALDCAYVSSGRVDLYLEPGIYIWDFAAGAAILTSAGGRADFFPRKKPVPVQIPPPDTSYDVVFSNGAIHEIGLQFMETVRG
jgi:myo-inositol-1(or 4)-monophosphatase